METSHWQYVAHEQQWYKRREPEKSELYRLVYFGRDELLRVWEERYQARYGVLRGEVLKTFDAYLNCGLLCHGAARLYCDTCRYSALVGFSRRMYEIDPLECPKCKSRMLIVAFITDLLALKQLLQSLGLPQFSASPKLPFHHFPDEVSACC